MLRKRLRWGFVGEAGYVATRQTRQLGYKQLNWAPIGGGTTGQQLFSKFGRTANTREASPVGGSHYDAPGHAAAPFANGYSFFAGYTWGKSITNSGADSSDASIPVNIPEYFGLNRSVSGFDRTHNFQLTNIFESVRSGTTVAPQRGRIVSEGGPGMAANSLISLMSGRPCSVSASGTSLETAPFSTQRADQVKGEVKKLGGIGRGAAFFDPTAFAGVSDPRFGTAGFNSLRGPGRVSLGISASSGTSGSRRRWTWSSVRSPSTSPTRRNSGIPGANVSNLQFNPDGSIRSLNGFAEITSASEERQFSFGLRVSF